MNNPFDYLSSNYKKAVFRLIKHLALNSKKWSRSDLLKKVERNLIDLYYDEFYPYPTCLFMGINEAKPFLNSYKQSSIFSDNIDIEKYLINENYIRKS